MNLYESSPFGVPLRPPSPERPRSLGTTGNAETSTRRERRDGRGGSRRMRNGIDGSGRSSGPSVERAMDDMIVDPAFWGTVFTTLSHNPVVAEEIRRDLEEEEARVARSRDTAAPRLSERTRDGFSDSSGIGGGYTVDGPGSSSQHTFDESTGVDAGNDDADADPSYDRSIRAERLPDLYDFMTRGIENLTRTTLGVQRLDKLMDELDIGALWSARDVMISFGPLTRVLLRLFIGPYATEEERLIVRMLNLGVERASKNFGFQDYRSSTERGGSTADSTEPFYLTYRRRGRALRDFAAFRYMLEIAERMGRIGRKHKNDLILLYMTLTTPEVRLHRRWDAEDREHVIAFRDRVTGFAMTTPPVMARPMSIEMHLDSVFGNVSTNTRLLERSLAIALNNRNRKVPTGTAAVSQEVESLLGNARSLDLKENGVTGVGVSSQLAKRPNGVENEHAALRHMLESSVIVSMMAEEYRVFVAGAPASRCGSGTRDGVRANKRGTLNGFNKIKTATAATGSARSTMFRRPIFFIFKPTSQAVVSKEQ